MNVSHIVQGHFMVQLGLALSLSKSDSLSVLRCMLMTAYSWHAQGQERKATFDERACRHLWRATYCVQQTQGKLNFGFTVRLGGGEAAAHLTRGALASRGVRRAGVVQEHLCCYARTCASTARLCTHLHMYASPVRLCGWCPAQRCFQELHRCSLKVCLVGLPQTHSPCPNQECSS